MCFKFGGAALLWGSRPYNCFFLALWAPCFEAHPFIVYPFAYIYIYLFKVR